MVQVTPRSIADALHFPPELQEDTGKIGDKVEVGDNLPESTGKMNCLVRQIKESNMMLKRAFDGCNGVKILE